MQSRIVPIEAAQKGPEDLHHNYAGRRVDNVLEVLPYSDIEDSPMVDGNSKHLNFEKRWNKAGIMLLKESEEWLKVGNYKSPMDQYLEELSKRNVPKRLKS